MSPCSTNIVTVLLCILFIATCKGGRYIFRRKNFIMQGTKRYGLQTQNYQQQEVFIALCKAILQYKLHVRAYYEQPRIVHQRHTYLRRMRKNRAEGRPVVYLDETWCNVHDGKSKAWVENDTTCRGGTIGGPAGLVHFQ